MLLREDLSYLILLLALIQFVSLFVGLFTHFLLRKEKAIYLIIRQR